MSSDNITSDIRDYWTLRTASFSEIRQSEIGSEIGRGWRFALRSTLPINRYRKILDVGTGTGFFSILLSQDGYKMTGIDITPSMIDEARREAAIYNCKANFLVMDAMEPAFEEESFDAVITRNLTWTLADVKSAYERWYKLIRPGGRLINYDANYAKALRSDASHYDERGERTVYGHEGITEELSELNSRIMLSMPIGQEDRPKWDKRCLEEVGFTRCYVDMDEAESILGLKSDPNAPMFKIIADK